MAVALPAPSIASAGPFGSPVFGSSATAPVHAPPGGRVDAPTERTTVGPVKLLVHKATASPSGAATMRGPTTAVLVLVWKTVVGAPNVAAGAVRAAVESE